MMKKSKYIFKYYDKKEAKNKIGKYNKEIVEFFSERLCFCLKQ